MFFFFNDTATTEIYTLSLHDALPIFRPRSHLPVAKRRPGGDPGAEQGRDRGELPFGMADPEHERLVDDDTLRIAAESVARSEEHTSELQSRQYLVCRLLLEKKKKNKV